MFDLIFEIKLAFDTFISILFKAVESTKHFK